MKKTITFAIILALAPLAAGCGLFGIGGGKNYDGTEAFNQAHPGLSDPPSYMQPDPTPLDGK